MKKVLRWAVLTGMAMGLAVAAPKLRLQTTTVGPVYIATGQDGTLNSIPVQNLGDGKLNLAVTGAATGDVPWMAPCIEDEGQLQVNIMLFTSKLKPGTYTGVATVTDPNAIDGEQTITITIVVGSGTPVPETLDFYVPPGGSQTTVLYAGCTSANVTNPSGGPVITVSSPARTTSFGGPAVCPDAASHVQVSVPPATIEGDYKARIGFETTSFFKQTDAGSTQVAVHVTSGSVASFAPGAVFFRMTASDPKLAKIVTFTNVGGGDLYFKSMTADVDWLTASTVNLQMILTADASKLAPGDHAAKLTVTSSAVNGPAVIPVVLTVLPAGPPVAYAGQVVENALFQVGDPVAPGGIVALFGERLTEGAVTTISKLPLTPVLGGISVFVNERQAPVYYTSPSQVNFVMPYATETGTAVVRVERNGSRGNSITVPVVARAPRILLFYPAPLRAGVDTAVFYLLGMGQTDPPQIDGQPGVGRDMTVAGVEAVALGQTLQPSYAGIAPGWVALYQVNVPLPASLPKGQKVPIFFRMPDGSVSNTVYISIQ